MTDDIRKGIDRGSAGFAEYCFCAKHKFYTKGHVCARCKEERVEK